MNDKTREFALQAGLPTALDYHQKRYEKFAELIIRECFSYTKDGDLDFMKFMIKKSFGVEE